jgi:phage/plasmid-associated DNA primase
MRENFVGIRPVAKLWLAGNNRLDIREQTEGIWRRYREIPFERVIPEDQRDKQLEEKLKAESPGILAWIVRACLDWQKHGLGKSSKVSTATADYRCEMDRLGPFIDERCTVTPSATVPRAALYQAYLAWTQHQGSHAVSDKAFAELMRGKGFVTGQSRINGKNARVWRGVGLLECNTCNTFPKESPYEPISFSSREVIGKNSRESVASVAPDAPDPLAQLAHCLRAKPDTTASDADKQALAEHFSRLNGAAESAGERLWNYWKAAPSPTVSDFLAREPKAKEGAQ